MSGCPAPGVRTRFRYFKTYNKIKNVSPRLASCKSCKCILYNENSIQKKKKSSRPPNKRIP